MFLYRDLIKNLYHNNIESCNPVELIRHVTTLAQFFDQHKLFKCNPANKITKIYYFVQKKEKPVFESMTV